MASPYSLLPVLVMIAPIWVAEWITRHHARPRPDLPLAGRELGRKLLDRAGLHDIQIGRTLETQHQPFEGAYIAPGRFVGLSARVDAERSIAAYALAAHGVGQAVEARAGRLMYGERHKRALGLAFYALPILFVAAILVFAAAPRGASYASLPLAIAFAGPGFVIGGLMLLRCWSELRVDLAQALPMLASGHLGPADLRAARRVLVVRALAFAGMATLFLLASLGILLVWFFS